MRTGLTRQSHQFIKEKNPLTALSMTLTVEAENVCTVIVPANQLSLAIGNKGQNARLAAKLTGWKIDIKPDTPVQNETEIAAQEAGETDEAAAE